MRKPLTALQSSSTNKYHRENPISVSNRLILLTLMRFLIKISRIRDIGTTSNLGKMNWEVDMFENIFIDTSKVKIHIFKKTFCLAKNKKLLLWVVRCNKKALYYIRLASSIKIYLLFLKLDNQNSENKANLSVKQLKYHRNRTSLNFCNISIPVKTSRILVWFTKKNLEVPTKHSSKKSKTNSKIKYWADLNIFLKYSRWSTATKTWYRSSEAGTEIPKYVLLSENKLKKQAKRWCTCQKKPK